jgi:hypothetical protein
MALLGSANESSLYPLADPNRTCSTASLGRRYNQKASFEALLGVAFKQPSADHWDIMAEVTHWG